MTGTAQPDHLKRPAIIKMMPLDMLCAATVRASSSHLLPSTNSPSQRESRTNLLRVQPTMTRHALSLHLSVRRSPGIDRKFFSVCSTVGFIINSFLFLARSTVRSNFFFMGSVVLSLSRSTLFLRHQIPPGSDRGDHTKPYAPRIHHLMPSVVLPLPGERQSSGCL